MGQGDQVYEQNFLIRFIIINCRDRKETQKFLRFLACLAVNKTKTMTENKTAKIDTFLYLKLMVLLLF